MKMVIAIITAVLALSSMAANATIIIYEGLQCDTSPGSGCVDNVLFSQGDMGTTLTGVTNGNPAQNVLVESSESLLVTGGGQGQISSLDGNGFMDGEITLQDPLLGFGTIQFNLKTEVAGDVTLEFEDQFGTIFGGIFALSTQGSGENKFSATSIDNQVIVRASFFSTVGITAIEDLKQIRLDPIPRDDDDNGPCMIDCGPVSVPEPGVLTLLSLGLVGLGLSRRASNA